MAHKRSQQIMSHGTMDGVSQPHQSPITATPVAKRQRTQLWEHKFPGFPDLVFTPQRRLIPAEPSWSHTDICPGIWGDTEAFFCGQGTTQSFPRIVSSAHINELVAKYSSPQHDGFEQDLWSDHPIISEDHRDGLNVYRRLDPPALLEAKMSDTSTADSHSFLETSENKLPSKADTLRAGAGEMILDSQLQSTQAAEVFFEDLAVMAQFAHESEEDESLVEGLTLGDETRHAVEEWLRDSPVAVDGHPPSGDSEKVDDGERSLPLWVLEELGEGGIEAAGLQPQHRLVRAESSGSTTNGPSFSLEGNTWEADPVRETSPLQTLVKPGHGEQHPVPKALTFDGAELSTHSCSGPQDDLGGVDSKPSTLEEMILMSRSFSTSWMKDLLEDNDTFEGDLGLSHSPSPHAEGLVSCSTDWTAVLAM